MANTNNTRRVRHVKRTTRRDGRRTARAAIAKGDYDNLASGERMVRTTPVTWSSGTGDDTRTPWEV